MHSMTGFGRGTYHSFHGKATVEVNSVNRKQAEIVVNLPKGLQGLEGRVRQTALPLISRGRVQFSIQFEESESQEVTPIKIHIGLAKSFEAAFLELSIVLGRKVMPTAADFLRQPGIFEICEIGNSDHEKTWEIIEPAIQQALSQLIAMRAQEGEHLKEDLKKRLSHIVCLTERLIEHAPSRPARQRDVLMKRLTDLGMPIDLNDERLLREIALFADRCDITEEITRLHSHYEKFQSYLETEDSAGRSLDFLCQEMFREFNTIGSKANDSLIAQTIVEAKTELEKIREQIQNIE